MIGNDFYPLDYAVSNVPNPNNTGPAALPQTPQPPLKSPLVRDPLSLDVDRLRSVLRTQPDQPQELTFIRHTDSRTALSRGLKEYLEGASIQWMDGRLIQPESVTYDWAPPELPAKFPAISIFASGEAQYEANKSSPTQLNDGSHRWLRSNSQLMQKFSVMLWANDATARSALLAAIEDMLEPVDWMQGVRLMLPYYFGVHATYEKLSVSFLDSPDNAQKRWRLATISVNGYIPQYIPLQSIPMIRPSAQVIVDSEPV